MKHPRGESSSPLACGRAERLMQRALDRECRGDEVEILDRHAAVCLRCRELWSELQSAQSALRSLPVPSLPDSLLQEVWKRTIDAPHTNRSSRRNGGKLVVLRVAATLGAAALLAAAASFLWQPSPPVKPAPRDEELAKAAADVLRVFELTSGALKRTEETAVQTIVGDALYPALERIPLFDSMWPAKIDEQS